MVGKLTCQNKTLVDYALGDIEMFGAFHDFKLLDFEPLLSDVHCGLQLSLNMHKTTGPSPTVHDPVDECTQEDSINNGFKDGRKKLRWNWSDSNRNNFLENINTKQLDKINHEIENFSELPLDEIHAKELVNENIN